jgi:hypothetical protein
MSGCSCTCSGNNSGWTTSQPANCGITGSFTTYTGCCSASISTVALSCR